MNELFLKIINMSISASWLVLSVLILRFVLKKAPKWVNVLLWGIVAVRLLCPFSIESALSLIPSAETIPVNIEMDTAPAINSGINAINSIVNPMISQANTPVNGASANPLQIIIAICANIWTFGVAALLIYIAISYWRLRRKVDTAILYRDNIFQSENVSSPFVLGIIRPRIYLPFKMDEQNFGHVVAHEQAHIRRKDNWWKPFGFLLLIIHWFNPLMWLAYVMLCRDIELACDEKVIKGLDNEQRADYTQALVACSVDRRIIAACPLAFGEVSVKERVKSIMNYKKPAFWIVIISVIACVIVAVCFLTNPKQDKFDIRIVVPAGSQESFIYSDEEISPNKNQIIIASGDNLADAEVVLKPIEASQENVYDESFYLTSGMPVKINAEKGAWFKIGINMQNSTNEDIVVYVSVENVDVRIASVNTVDIEQYRTEYIGDVSNVSAIAQNLPYPKGYSYSSIELQTNEEPYELIVYINGEGNIAKNDLKQCAATAFELIGNMDVITFCVADIEKVISSFYRERSEIYTEAEIESAINEIKSCFKEEFEGCTLTEIGYAGDEKSLKYAEWAERNDADEVIVLTSSFDVDSSGGDGSLNPNSTYTDWMWILVRSNGGRWKHVDHGY